jgi:hypothetical protein
MVSFSLRLAMMVHRQYSPVPSSFHVTKWNGFGLTGAAPKRSSIRDVSIATRVTSPARNAHSTSGEGANLEQRVALA